MLETAQGLVAQRLSLEVVLGRALPVTAVPLRSLVEQLIQRMAPVVHRASSAELASARVLAVLLQLQAESVAQLELVVPSR